MEFKNIFIAFILSRLYESVLSQAHQIKRRSNNGEPRLNLKVRHSIGNSLDIMYGSDYDYGFTVSHDSDSFADALGVHVIWMLTPFVKFKKVTSFQFMGKYRVEQKDDSVTFKIDEIPWMTEANFTFNVIFDSQRSLNTGKHFIATPVQLLYYKEYSENPPGHVITKGVPYSTPLETLSIEVEIPGCSGTLGMASGEIKDYQLTASSSYAETRPTQARPSDSSDAWCASTENTEQYIQVDFTRKTHVNGVKTYGRSQKAHWVKKYVIQYSTDEETWHNYTEHGFVKEFTGNSDQFTPVFHLLINEIEANSLRLRPLDWENLICMRFEMYGCKIAGAPVNCIDPLGLESGYIPDEALTQGTNRSNPTDIRLNKVIGKFPYGWQAWQDPLGRVDYLQVDFGSLRKVTRVATQGSAGMITFFVKTFKLKFSNNSIDWIEYSENGKTKELKGPKDKHEAKYTVVVKLLEPVKARYIRFIPTSAQSVRVMRAELYGCMAEPMPPYDGFPGYSRRTVLLDPDSGCLFVCMYTELRTESSCFFSCDGQEWQDIDVFIVSIIALELKSGQLFGLDHRMNIHRSTDHGASWKVISSEYFSDVRNLTSLLMSTGIPENLVSVKPETFWQRTTSNGMKWAVTGSGIHMMTADQKYWRMVASWKCCGN
ncbi:uncharacterized protein [Montipora capricornis]|uniref:uncharacterized protein n=1 Tax=Montipora capricornis TaxID=246305 RepID=UPI0035F13ECA